MTLQAKPALEMSDTSSAAYIWVAILGLILAVLGVALDFAGGSWLSDGSNLFDLGFAVLLFSIALLIYSKE